MAGLAVFQATGAVSGAGRNQDPAASVTGSRRCFHYWAYPVSGDTSPDESPARQDRRSTASTLDLVDALVKRTRLGGSLARPGYYPDVPSWKITGFETSLERVGEERIVPLSGTGGRRQLLEIPRLLAMATNTRPS